MSTSFLIAEGLSKKFPGSRGKPDLTVFDDVHFTIDKGEFVCIIGHSGCGKTTILNVLAGLDTASGGNVLNFAKHGAGMLTLTGANTYSGTTTIYGSTGTSTLRAGSAARAFRPSRTSDTAQRSTN